MCKRLLLAVMLATVFVMPVMANVTAESKCDFDTLGVTQGNTVLTANWAPEIISCDPGKYLDARSAECADCPHGSYCEGIENIEYDGEDHGIAACEPGWTSDKNTETESKCYQIDMVVCSEHNPYTHGHGTAVYANTSTICKTYYGTSECVLDDESVCDIVSLNCDSGYKQDTINGVLQCVPSSVDCPVGTYLPYTPGEAPACAPCPGDAYCPGDVYDSTIERDQGAIACASGLKAPIGARSENDCGRILHVGDNILYLHKDKRTEHSLVIKVEGVTYYADTTPTSEGVKTMDGRDAGEEDTGKVLRINIDGVEYSVHNTIYND